MIAAEKRRHPRFPLGIALDIQTRTGGMSRRRGAITDLSASGMTFKTDTALEKGMSLHLKLGKIPLEIRGEVCHGDSAASGGLHRYGIRFHKIARFQKNRISGGRVQE